MRDKLILMTSEFPYGSGETYLEAELPYLAERFKDIIVVPINSNNTVSRKIPQNVSVSPFLEKKKFSRKAVSLKVHGRALMEFTKEILEHFKLYGIFPRPSMYLQLLEYLEEGSQIKDFIKSLLVKSESASSETVVYSYWSAHSAVAAAQLKKEFPSLFVVSRAHGWDLYFERGITRYIPFRPFILKTIDKMYPVSGQGAHYLNSKLGFKYQNKIEARYLGVQMQALETTENTRCADLHLVSCARLVDLKRIHLISDALKNLLKNGDTLPRIHWTHIGGGPLFISLKDEVEEGLDDQQQITYDFKGDLTNEEVLEFYNTYYVDLFLCTSEWEGLPVAIMEAASFSIPIISTDVGGISEIVINGRNGWLVPKTVTGAELADMIERWIAFPEVQKQQFRLKSHHIVEERFCAKTNFRDWTDELISS